MSRFLFSAAITDVPEEVEILQAGKFNHRVYGEFEVKPSDLESMVAEFQKDPEALVDVDHKASKGETRAAGWVKALRIEGDKLIATPTWTPYGKSLLENREYRRVSAEFGPRRDHTGKVGPVALQAFTLTNRPFLRTLKPLTLMEGDETLILDGMASCADHEEFNNECTACRALDETPEATLSSGGGAGPSNNKDRSMTDKIRSVLSLADDASDDDVTAAIKALQEPKTDVVALADYESVKKLAENAQKAADEAARVAAESQKELADLHRDTWVSEQIRQGRLIPAETEAMRELYDAAPDAVRKLVEARPKDKSLTLALGHAGGDDTGEIDLSTQEGRNALDKRAYQLMHEHKIDLGEAQIMAEKELTS